MVLQITLFPYKWYRIFVRSAVACAARRCGLCEYIGLVEFSARCERLTLCVLCACTVQICLMLGTFVQIASFSIYLFQGTQCRGKSIELSKSSSADRWAAAMQEETGQYNYRKGGSDQVLVLLQAYERPIGFRLYGFCGLSLL